MSEEPAEVLIQEARRRQRRRQRWLAVAMLLVLATAAAYLASTDGGRPAAPHDRPAAAHREAPVAGLLAGTWHVHTFVITIPRDGHGTLVWPIHVRCGTAGAPAAPCDRWTPGTEVVDGRSYTTEQITDGGRANLVLTSVTGTRARGVITGSTQPSVVPDGKVTLSVDTHRDVLSASPAVSATGPSPFHFGTGQFCGPAAAALPVARQQAEQINCGA